MLRIVRAQGTCWKVRGTVPTGNLGERPLSSGRRLENLARIEHVLCTIVFTYIRHGFIERLLVSSFNKALLIKTHTINNNKQ